MSKSGVKVETDQLKACAQKYKNLAEQYKSDWDIIESKLNECQTYWQGSFASDMDEVLNNVKKTREEIYKNTIKLSSFINEAALLYEKYDGDIARALRDDPSLNSDDYPDNVNVSKTIINYGGNAFSCAKGYKPDQYNYYQYAEEYGGRYGRYQYACSLCSMATCLSIALGKQITPDDLRNQGYWGSGGVTNWSYSQKNCSIKYNAGLRDIYNSINDNHPCILKFEGAGGGTHFVAAVGIRSGADPNNLTMNDILVADPANPKVNITLQEAANTQKSYDNRYLTGFMASY